MPCVERGAMLLSEGLRIQRPFGDVEAPAFLLSHPACTACVCRGTRSLPYENADNSGILVQAETHEIYYHFGAS